MTWLNVEQAADYLGLTKNGIYGLTHQNKVPYYRLGEGRLRFSQEELDDWLKAKRVKTTAELQAEAEAISQKMKKHAI